VENAWRPSRSYARRPKHRGQLVRVGWTNTRKGIGLGRMVMPEPYLAIRVVMMPRDTNPLGSIFGGVILSHIDSAGAIGARHEIVRAGGPQPYLLTVAINKVEFKQPVMVGDVVRSEEHTSELQSR